MSRQLKSTWIIVHAIAHSLMVHTRVLEDYIHFDFMYTAYHTLTFLSIKDLTKKTGNLTTTFKPATGMKHSILHLNVSFFPCVVQKATAYIGTKELNMCHQSEKGFRGFFSGIPQRQKRYLVYVRHNQKIVYLYDVIVNKSFSIALTYTSQPY